jgi:hypothetical protein
LAEIIGWNKREEYMLVKALVKERIPIPPDIRLQLGGVSSIQFPFRSFLGLRTVDRQLAVSGNCFRPRAREAGQVVFMTGRVEARDDLKLAVAVPDEAELDYRGPIDLFLNNGKQGHNIYTEVEQAQRETIYVLAPLTVSGEQALLPGRGDMDENSHRLDLIHQIMARYRLSFSNARDFVKKRPQLLNDYSLGYLQVKTLFSALCEHFGWRKPEGMI